MQIQQQRDDTLEECLNLKGQNRLLDLKISFLTKENNLLKSKVEQMYVTN